MIKQLLLLAGLVGAAAPASHGQSARLNDFHSLAWLVYVGDHKVADKWAIHTEYQWRRVDWLRDPQQQLARLGLVRTLSARVKASGGYTYFQSHRYGQYAEVPGQATPEHRLYEDVSLADRLGRVGLSQRIRLEQRWIGARGPTGEGPVERWEYQNRIRYQLEAELPLQGASLDDKEFYLTAFDELFIGFGQNVGQNVFNQNRLSGGLGYQFTDNAKLELNYLYQVRSHSEPDAASSQPVVELNNGLRLNVVYNLDFTKKS
ncbi:DUF2490 domain-containing protein [Hymenobacter cheonanensis]|uniref:DUF2490 domain-containing protein n=1 Tax=Hymenobacter sp. CA2-7 TaxID=3063993 RepID=UPI002712950A|nr:DUF2490 domain-containing protein [Hymenobacter sp. CA2-7]MDO7884216.1 DUF2490 domain-containing protein [Hymenobacter sp. CA2-7]